METLNRYAPYALAALRIVAALLFMEHGTQKLFGFPASPEGGGGPLDTIHLVAGLLEFIGGILLLLGLFTRPVAFILAGQMAIAYWWVHFTHGGFYPVLNRGDAAILFCFIFLYLVFAGPGHCSLDRMRGKA